MDTVYWGDGTSAQDIMAGEFVVSARVQLNVKMDAELVPGDGYGDSGNRYIINKTINKNTLNSVRGKEAEISEKIECVFTNITSMC